MPKRIGLWDVGNRTVALSAALLLSGVLNGCYEFVPAPSDAVAPGQPIAVEINDQGRVGLGNVIGAEVRRLSGTLISESDQQLEMRVTELTFLNDRTSQWSGEHLTVPKQYARTVFEQKLSRGRTVMATVVSAGLIVAAILTSSLSGRGGNDGGVGKPPPPPPNQ
jgi:hypothetical protein